MKKVLVLLLVLAFTATFVSAEGVSFGAWTRTVYNLAVGSTDPASSVTQSLGPNWYAGGNSSNGGSGNGSAGLYASLNLNYQGAVFGYHIGWETEGGQLNTVPGHFLNFNVSVNLIADMLTLSVGKISSDQFKLAKDANDVVNGGPNWLMGRFEVSDRSNLSHGLADTTTMGLAAAQVVFAPKDSGLAIGVYMPLNQGGSKFTDNVDNLFVGASYAIAGVGKITLVTTPNENGDYFYDAAFTRAYDLGFQLTAVKGLDVLIAGGYMSNRYDTTGKSDAIAANVGVSFNIDAFSMGVASYMRFNMTPTAANANKIQIDTNPSINLGVVSLGETVSILLTMPGSGTNTTDWKSYTWASFNPVGIKLGFELTGSSASGSFIGWKIPVAIDLGF